MKNLFRKSLSVILTLSMLLSSIPFAALAEDIVEPTVEPTVEATAEITPKVTEEPTVKPTNEVTVELTAEPTTEATAEPTAEPTTKATAEPTAEPTVEATVEPTVEPTTEATAEPTTEPMVEATVEPTVEPMTEATAEPTIEPTKEPMVAMFAMPRMLSTASSDEQLNIARKGTLVEGNTITVVWNEMTGVDHYEITVKDETAESYLYERKSVGTSRSFALEGLLANHTYKVWVGAVCPDSEAMGIPGTHQDTMTFTIEAAEEEEYDELVVSIEDPGEVIVGDSLIVRSDVSGGSGEYSYSWKWTHPSGTEMTDANKNVRILGTVKGEYTFILTVTDEVTGEVCTTKKKTIEVGSDEEEYDPMKLTLTGPADEVELAEGGIGAVCSVKGGSGNFEYGWTIYLDGAKHKEYSYGMVEETCTLDLEKTGSYTISVTVRDLETGLTETASCSTKVVQKEYDPLTVEITSAPKYADIDETVSIKAVSTGGYGNVVTSYEVFLGNTCVAQGSGLEFSFVPSSEGKYKVVVRAEDDAQWVQDTAEILVGKLVKCSVSVSSAEVNVGDSITAAIAVTDGIGPFSYDWMLYLDDVFVSSDLNSEKTSFTWAAEKAGTYRIDGSVFDEGKEELIGELSFDSDSKNVVSKAVILTPELTANKTEVMVGDSVTFTVANIDAYTEVYLYAEDYKLATLTAAQNTHTETFSQAGERTIILKDAEGNALCSVKVTVEQLGVLSNPVLTASSPQKIGDGLRVSWTKVDYADQYSLKVKCPDGTTNTYEYAGSITEAVVTDLTQAGTYGVWMMATGYGYSQSQSDSVTVVMEETVPVVKPADPEVKVSVEGITVLASWEAVEGAASYVYSVRDLDADKLVREYADGNSRTITLMLEAGKKYRLAVAAVPAGVDPRTEATLCGWCQVEFETTTEEKPVKPADPVVTVNVEGALMLAHWEAVEGAASYVYSVRDLDADKLVREYADGNSRTITLELEAGKKYRLAVAAVPAGVDPRTEATLCGWCQVEFETAAEEKLAKPNVKVTVDGLNMVATWPAVEGADRYVFSLRDTSKSEAEYKHVETKGCSISLTLEAGVEYKLAVAAVPAEVKNTVADSEKCSWTEVVFKIETAEEMSTPKVLAVESNVNGVLAPGSTVTVKVVCNSLTSKLNISGIANGQVGKLYFDDNGRSCFDYSVVVSANGKYQLVFQAVDPNGKYSNNDAHKGFLNITVCDHTTTKTPTKKIIENNPNSNTTHNSVQLYDEACVCGKIKNPNVRGEVVAVNCKFTVSNGSDSKHVSGKGKGHEYLNKCSVAECKNTQGTGKYASYRDNCAACEKQYGKDVVAKDSKKNSSSKVTEVQQYLVALDYDISYINKNGQKVEVDGQFGDKTEEAVKKFQREHGLDDTGVVDDATWAKLLELQKGKPLLKDANECPKFGEHKYNVTFERHIDGYITVTPNGAYHDVIYNCECGKNIHATRIMENCCLCVGHSWNEYFDKEKMNAYRICLVCGKKESIQTNSSENYAAYLELQNNLGDKNGNGAYWRILAKTSNDYLANGYGFLGEFIEGMSGGGSYAYDKIVDDAVLGMDDRSKIQVDIWMSIIADVHKEYEQEKENVQTASSIYDGISLYTDKAIEKAVGKAIANVTKNTEVVQDLQKSIDAYVSGNVNAGTLTTAANANQQLTVAKENLNAATAYKNTAEGMQKLSKGISYALAGLNGLVEGSENAAKIGNLQKAYDDMSKDYEETAYMLLSIINDAKEMKNPELESAAQTILNEVTVKYYDRVSETATTVTKAMDSLGDFSEKGTAFSLGFIDGTAESLAGAGTASLGYMGLVQVSSWIASFTTNADEVVKQAEVMSILGEMASSTEVINNYYFKGGSEDKRFTSEIWAKLQQLGDDEAIKLVDILMDDAWYQYFAPGASTLKDFGINVDRESATQLLKEEKGHYQSYIDAIR